MWGALARQLAAYVLTRRGKKTLAFVGTMLLCFITAVLLDLEMYISAGLTGVLAFAALASWVTHSYKHRREREQREIERAVRRETAAKSRAERMDYARSTLSGAARNVTTGASNVASGATHVASGAATAAKNGLSGAWSSVSGWRRKKAPDQFP
jgi:Ca2+/Na+ antiporter